MLVLHTLDHLFDLGRQLALILQEIFNHANLLFDPDRHLLLNLISLFISVSFSLLHILLLLLSLLDSKLLHSLQSFALLFLFDFKFNKTLFNFGESFSWLVSSTDGAAR